MKIGRTLILCSLASLSLAFCSSPAGPPLPDPGGQQGYRYYSIGNPADVSTAYSPGLVLMGGGTDVDAAFQWLIQKSGGGDFVVIRASGTDAYNSYIYNLGQLDSVETRVVQHRAMARRRPFLHRFSDCRDIEARSTENSRSSLTSLESATYTFTQRSLTCLLSDDDKPQVR